MHAYDHSLGKWRQESQERGFIYIWSSRPIYATLDPVSKSQEVDREKMMEDENNEQYLTDVGMEWC